MESRVLSRTEELLNRRRAAVPRGVFNVASVFKESAEGARLRDVDGKTYLDFAGEYGGTQGSKIFQASMVWMGPALGLDRQVMRED